MSNLNGRHGVVTSGTERVATAQPAKGETQAVKETVSAEGFTRVVCARG